MAGHRAFAEVRAERARGPRYREEVDAIKRVMDEALTLAELRRRAGVTQTHLAEQLDITQGSVSRIEHQSDLVLSTIRSYVEALGGRLELRAVFDGESLPITAFPEGESTAP
ncbi:MAG: XRE family transcriptional regulator [Chloroflexi bacterium]|nr:XRE family transcriptional regulator [Chloroflexota bacterium]